MKNTPQPLIALALLPCLLSACGGGSNGDLTGSSSVAGSSSGAAGTARGTLLQNPPTLQMAITAQTLAAQLAAAASGAQSVLSDVLTIAGVPQCDINIYHVEYATVGGKGESTTASGALMVPTGSGAACTGARPIVLYAHGTQADKAFNIADLTNSENAEGLLLAAFFAARGYIVVAPNYTGYDTSTLPYHPFVVAAAQSDDMIDGLTASRTALTVVEKSATTATSDNGQLFVTGYSQGGYVAMATLRSMQSLNMSVTAGAPMSGPYALEAFVDAEFSGEVSQGAPVVATLLLDGYQNSYGNVYAQPTDVISAQYANGFTTLLPSATPRSQLYTAGLLPEFALFSATPPNASYAALTPATQPAALAATFALGFGDPPLIVNAYRLSYLQDIAASPDGSFPNVTTGLPATAPALPWRQDLKANDLRDWTPSSPTLLCGGDQDPTVYFFSTQFMQTYWMAHPSSNPAVALSVLDLDSPTSAGGVDGSLQTEFQGTKAAYAASAVVQGATDGGASAVASAYHETLVPPFCLGAVISFFNQF
jgi:poly(3-hydroxybutyrate) depolymerase